MFFGPSAPLDEVVTAKLAGHKPLRAPATQAEPVDLMLVLQGSLLTAQESRTTEEVPKGPAPPPKQDELIQRWRAGRYIAPKQAGGVLWALMKARG